MEYKKLEKPIYWMGFVKGKFLKRKFIECQAAFPRYLRDDEGNVRFFSRNMENGMNEIDWNGYSQYSYKEFTKDDEIKFLKAIVKHNNERIGQLDKKIGLIGKETDKIIDIIKEKEKR